MRGARPCKHFIQQLPIYIHTSTTPPTTKGRTWMELFIIYHMMGNTSPAPQPQLGMNKWSLGQSLHHFRLQVRRMVNVFCPATQQQCLVGRAAGQPLLHLGITTHLVTLPITIQLTPEAENELATRIIQSQASCSHKAATLKLQNRQWVIQHRLRTRGRVKWLAILRE